MIICSCFGVSLEDVEKVIEEGAETTDEIIQITKMTLSCGSCKEELEKIVEQYSENTERKCSDDISCLLDREQK